MAGVASKFATAENFNMLQDGLKHAEEAIHEATLAEQAKLPNAKELLTNAETAKARLLQIINTYFPNGAPTA